VHSFGTRSASGLDVGEFEDWLAALGVSYAPTYVRNLGACVQAAFRWSTRARPPLLATNPIEGASLPTVPRSSPRFAERAEAAAFLRFWLRFRDRKTVRGRYDRATVLLERCLIRTGARPKELAVLRWSDIAFNAWKTPAGHFGAKAVLPPDRWKAGKKTGKPRTIFFPPALARALRRLRDRGPTSDEAVFIHGAGAGGRGAGKPWRNGAILSRAVMRMRRRLISLQVEIRGRVESGGKVKPWEARLASVAVSDVGDNRLTNYRFRHTAISTLLMHGVDVPTVAELVGTSPEMIYRTYGHLLDSHLAAAAAKLAGRR
jgi:integrase